MGLKNSGNSIVVRALVSHKWSCNFRAIVVTPYFLRSVQVHRGLCIIGWVIFATYFLSPLPGLFFGVMALSDHKYSFKKNNLSIFRAGRVEEFAAAKCHFLTKLVLAARNNKVKLGKMCADLVKYRLQTDTSWTSLRHITLSKHEQILQRFKLSGSHCCYGRPVCEHHFFSAMRWLHHPFWCLLGRWFWI